MSLTIVTCPCGARLAVDPHNVMDKMYAQDNIRLFVSWHSEHGAGEAAPTAHPAGAARADQKPKETP